MQQAPLTTVLFALVLDSSAETLEETLVELDLLLDELSSLSEEV